MIPKHGPTGQEQMMISMQKIASGQDTTMAYNSILRMFGALPSVIVLRGTDQEDKIVNYLNFDMLPELRPFVFGVMARILGEELGKVFIESVKPGQKLSFAQIQTERYLVPLNIMPGVLLNSTMILPGDVWWVNGKSEAELINNSTEDFVGLFIEAVPNSPATYLPEGSV